MVTGLLYSHKARLRSYELVAEVRDRLAAQRKSARESVSSLVS